MTKKKDPLEEIRADLLKFEAKAKKSKGPIGQVIGYSERRDILKVTDTVGAVIELLPLSETKISLNLSLEHPTSGETLYFSVPMPDQAWQFYTTHRVKMARSVPHMAEQLVASLKGVKDNHDKVVDIVEKKLKAKTKGKLVKKSRK